MPLRSTSDLHVTHPAGEIPPSRFELLWARIRRAARLREYPRRYFERIYTDPDPWSYLTSPYEMAKYERTLSLLPRERFARTLDVGCSIGVLTEKLARRSDYLDAIDFIPRVVERARSYCQRHPHVRVHVSDLLRFSTCRPYDLIMCSEILYYLWNPVRCRRAARQKLETLIAPHGHLLVVWGGCRLEQDWDSFLQGSQLRLVRSEMQDDAVRPYRMSLLQWLRS